MISLSRTFARMGTLAAVAALSVQHAFAQVPAGILPSAPDDAVGADGSIDIKDIIAFAATYLLSIAGGLAVLFLVVGGIIYTTAGGSDEKVAKAKKYMMNAIVGLVVVLLAFVIVGNTLSVTYRLNGRGTAANNPPSGGAASITGATLNCGGPCTGTLAATPAGTTLTGTGNTRTIVLPAGIPAGTPVAVTVTKDGAAYASGTVTK